jgi:hypothetical protein
MGLGDGCLGERASLPILIVGVGRCGEIGVGSEDVAVLIIALLGGGGWLAWEKGGKRVSSTLVVGQAVEWGFMLGAFERSKITSVSSFFAKGDIIEILNPRNVFVHHFF